MNKVFTFLCITLCLLLSDKLIAQHQKVTLSGVILDPSTRTAIPYATIILSLEKDSSFVSGTVSDDEGNFNFTNISPSAYYLEISTIGYETLKKPVYVGNLSQYLNIGKIELNQQSEILEEITVVGKENQVSSKMDKKVYAIDDNVSQSGGSILQTMQNLPGVTVQDGKVLLRGSEKIAVLIDGQQSALTGFGSQKSLDNIPASNIEKIEIVNNPSAKYDANGNAGIINIIYKKNKQEGLNGKIALTTGLGALFIKKENLPNIRPQYQNTPKINPSIALNYKRNKYNVFIESDVLYTETLNKNEFIDRSYEDGSKVLQQLKRNRNTTFTTTKLGLDYSLSEQDRFTISGLYGTEKIIDRGDEPFFLNDLSNRYRLWQFLEDEIKTTAVATAIFSHKFHQVGHELNFSYNYTFHREDEQYFFTNTLPLGVGEDAFKLLSDEKVSDFSLDYSRPMKSGKLEGGIKFRRRTIPTNMQFFPGANSPIDADAGGWATYSESIPALYGNYVFESKKFESEIGLRMEYVDLNYEVNPDHPTYSSDGYDYLKPFPTIRIAYKLNDYQKISLFYNRRVDRPNEVDIRIFPKYDDAELIKVGNPALRPQFTNTVELAYKKIWENGSFYSSIFHRRAEGTITRIASSIPGSNLLYAIFQNAGKSYNTGLELILSQQLSSLATINANITTFRNQIDAFTVSNLYPEPNTFSAPLEKITSYSVKLNSLLKPSVNTTAQISFVYLGPDLIPQGRIDKRYSLDIGIRQKIQKGKGELFLNATDILNTMVITKDIKGQAFSYISNDYYETQVVRIGYSMKF